MAKKKIKYCLEKIVTDIRLHPDLNEWIANTPDGKEVFVKPQDYILDTTKGETKYRIRVSL